MFSNNKMFVNVAKLSSSGIIIDDKDINHKIKDYFGSNEINSKTSF